jgi:hypothetical protein
MTQILHTHSTYAQTSVLYFNASTNTDPTETQTKLPEIASLQQELLMFKQKNSLHV